MNAYKYELGKLRKEMRVLLKEYGRIVVVAG